MRFFLSSLRRFSAPIGNSALRRARILGGGRGPQSHIAVAPFRLLQALARLLGVLWLSSGLTSCNKDTPKTPAAAPAFSVPSGSYTSVQSVTITEATANATIYYTTDGSTPITSSAVYSGPVAVKSSGILSAMAVAPGYLPSQVTSATYQINLITALPAFSLSPGTYPNPISVAITDATPNATIFFTTDGTLPSTSSSVYQAPLTVSTSQTLHAVATASGYQISAVAEATYTIAGGKPIVTLIPPAAGASQLSGYAYNVDPSVVKVVIYVLTNEWYVQPFVDSPYTTIGADGFWQSYTHPWQSIVVLLVDPAHYTPQATEISNPAFDPGVIAWTAYPSGPASVQFSGYTWEIKTTGSAPTDQFDPGPNFWSNDPTVVHMASDGLHLKINQIDSEWQCAEVYLPQSLGYGIYTVQIAAPLDQLDQNTVAAPIFIYAAVNQELDNEYSGFNGLIPPPDNAQFVVQPYTVPRNIVRYVQPSSSQFTSQVEWRTDHVTFRAWNGWSSTPAGTDVIYEWTYTGGNIPLVGQERVHINLWLLNGNAPAAGSGDEMVINSFSYQP